MSLIKSKFINILTEIINFVSGTQETKVDPKDLEEEKWFNDVKDWCKYSTNTKQCTSGKILVLDEFKNEGETFKTQNVVMEFNKFILENANYIKVFDSKVVLISNKYPWMKRLVSTLLKLLDLPEFEKDYYIPETKVVEFLERYGYDLKEFISVNRYYYYTTRRIEDNDIYIPLDTLVFGIVKYISFRIVMNKVDNGLSEPKTEPISNSPLSYPKQPIGNTPLRKNPFEPESVKNPKKDKNFIKRVICQISKQMRNVEKNPRSNSMFMNQVFQIAEQCAKNSNSCINNENCQEGNFYTQQEENVKGGKSTKSKSTKSKSTSSKSTKSKSTKSKSTKSKSTKSKSTKSVSKI